MPDDPLIRWETDGGATLPPDDERGARPEPDENATLRHTASSGVVVDPAAGTTS